MHASRLNRAWLLLLAITGVTFWMGESGSAVGSLMVALAVLGQAFVKGMVVALALRSVGYGRWQSAGLGVLSGLVEPVAAVFGVLVIALSVSLLPWGLAIAAGAMLFVISHEIIPESHRQGHEAYATGGLMVGFVTMMVLDTALG